MFQAIKKLMLFFIRIVALICLIGVLTGNLLPTPKCAQFINNLWPKNIAFPIKETIILKPEITKATLNNKSVSKNSLAEPIALNEDYYWKNKNINVYIDTPDQNYQAIYRYAMKAWNDFGYFRLIEVFHKNKADIICRLENKPNVDWIGRTNYVMNINTHELLSATIRLNTDSLKAYEINKGIRVAIHEFGHAVGLNKHNKDKNSIMYYEEDANQHLTSEDIKRIENLYMQTKGGDDSMNDFGIIIDNNTNVTEVIAKPITVQEMAKLARQTTSKKAIQHFVEKFQSKNVKNLVKLIQTSKIPIYFYALLNPEEKRYDWYIIDTSFNQMLRCTSLELDRISDWFKENGDFL